MDTPDYEAVFSEIFSSCDKNKTGFVCVTKLLEFISPFVDNNSEYLEEIKLKLDPSNTNPFLNEETFFGAMLAWVGKFKDEIQSSSSSPTQLQTNRILRCNESFLRQTTSTPTKEHSNIGNILQPDMENLMDLSNISSYSYSGSTTSGIDVISLQEQIKDLEHQVVRLNEIVCTTQQQLAASEEQNNSLHIENDELRKQLQNEQKVNKTLQKQREEERNDVDELSNVIQVKTSLEKILNENKRKYLHLKTQAERYENDNISLQGIITGLEEKNARLNILIESLRNEIKTNNIEIQNKSNSKETDKICYEDTCVYRQQVVELKSEIARMEQLNEAQNKTDINIIEEDFNKVKKKLEEMYVTDTTKTIKINTLENNIVRLNKELDQQQKEFHDAELIKTNKINDLELENKELNKEINKVKGQLNICLKELQETRNIESRKSRKLKILECNIDKSNNELDEEKMKIGVLKTRLNTLCSEKVTLDNVITQKDGEIKQLSLTIEKLETKVSKYRKIIIDKEQEKIEKFNEIKVLLRERINILKRYVFEAKTIWLSLIDQPNLSTVEIDIAEKIIEGPLYDEVEALTLQIIETCHFLNLLAKSTNNIIIRNNNILHSSETCTELKSGENEENCSIIDDIRNKFVLKKNLLPLFNELKSPRFSSMTPNCLSTEMSEVSIADKTYAVLDTELNSNEFRNTIVLRADDEKEKEPVIVSEELELTVEKPKKLFVTDDPDSGTNSDTGTSESCETESTNIRKRTERSFTLPAGGGGEIKLENEKQVQEGLTRQCRSLSEGAAISHQVTADGDVTVFPNLRDNVLEAMGLLLPGDKPREQLTDEEIETKFQTLTLAFAIDSVTLLDRFERQRRQRDQAEDNMATEIERLAHAVRRLQPLCIDTETTELVTGLLSHLDIILQASNRILISSEVYGSVQQEWRLAESVNLMLSHLRNLRQQRDNARRQLQCTKRMLQESALASEAAPTTNSSNAQLTSRQRLTATSNGRVVTRRRASIATIPRPLDSPSISGSNSLSASPVKRVGMRRTSSVACGEQSPKHWDARYRDAAALPLMRSRPSRLELNLDLVKINEGKVEHLINNMENESKCDSENTITEYETPNEISEYCSIDEDILEPSSRTKIYLIRILRRIGSIIEEYWKRIVEEGTLHEVCCLGAVICFALSTIIICSLWLEIWYAKKGIPVTHIPWSWMTWEELSDLFFDLFLTRVGPTPI